VKIFWVFGLGVCLGMVTGGYYFLNSQQTPQSQVLAIESTPSVTPTDVPTSTPSPTPKPTRTPTPTIIPTPTPTPKAPDGMDQIFNQMAEKYKVDANLLKKIANCETHYNPGVVSKNELYAGMFQFTISTWQSNRIAMGMDANPDLRFGIPESIETAAYMISKNGASAWPECSK
jgi:hypothetical protein